MKGYGPHRERATLSASRGFPLVVRVSSARLSEAMGRIERVARLLVLYIGKRGENYFRRRRGLAGSAAFGLVFMSPRLVFTNFLIKGTGVFPSKGRCTAALVVE